MDLLAKGGPDATKGFGRDALGSTPACAETPPREIVPERGRSAYRVRRQFDDAVAERVATPRQGGLRGAIFSRPSEKTHPTPRATAGPALASRSYRQWLPHGIMD